MTFTGQKIADLHLKAAEKKWPYPYLFNSLQAMGVERTETNVLTREIKYVGGGASLVVPAPDGSQPLTAAPRFDEAAIKLALERFRGQQIDHAQFLTEMAAAGVSFYRVDMRPRTATYHGPRPLDKWTEKIPETIQPQ